eukprot:TRINITY_DN7655_c0_g1_i1.p1 TRINITY_DN7655_c0_g1~~TRINITY_DN7655_c0_g1_i1.p1  ORF type:complete len:648 (+),score=97.79 TRINITY_DN7655_c0_g1_i1:24-1946(+)
MYASPPEEVELSPSVRAHRERVLALRSEFYQHLYQLPFQPDYHPPPKALPHSNRWCSHESCPTPLPTDVDERPLGHASMSGRFAPTVPEPYPQPRALLIGINYTGQGSRELHGCANDAAAFAQFLYSQGWSNVRLMTEEAGRFEASALPTLRNMQAGIRWLTEGAIPGQSLFFFFSGHAKQLADLSGDEADGFDEALVSLDGCALTDDELFALLVQPLPSGCRLTAVADCCHSGTILDLSCNYGITSGGGVHKKPSGRGYRPGARAEVVLLSACVDEQEAADVGPTSSAGGACTAAFLGLLQEEGPLLAYDQLLDGMWRRMARSARSHAQLPQISSTTALDLRGLFTLSVRGEPLHPVPQIVGLDSPNSSFGPDDDAFGSPARSKGWFSFSKLQDAFNEAAPVVTSLASTVATGSASGTGVGAMIASTVSQFVPTIAQIAQALKDALLEGIQWAIQKLSAPGGFLHDLRVRIPWPQEMRQVETALRGFGMDQQCDDFVNVVNRSAESASAGALEIFASCLRNMTIEEARRILDGKSNEATEFMRQRTTSGLTQMMAPLINNALEENTVTKYWDDLLAVYNQIPFLPKKDFDLGKYTVSKALTGVFLLIGEKEAQLRADPAGAASSLAQSVLQWKRDGCPE